MNDLSDKNYTWLGELRSTEKEIEFRKSQLSTDSIPTKFFIITMSLLVIFFIFNDYTLFYPSKKFFDLLIIRSIYILLSLGALWVITSSIKNLSIQQYDLICSLFITMYLTMAIYIDFSRPPDYFGSTYLLVLGALVVYTVFNISIKLQIFLALTISFSTMLLIEVVKSSTHGIEIKMFYISFAMINSLGFFISLKTNKIKRVDFMLKKSRDNLINELESSNNFKNKMFSIISHDLRSPFNALINYSQILNTDVKDIEIDEISQIARALNDSANILYNLLNNLLSWTQIDAGRIPFKPKVFDLVEIINANIRLFKETAALKNISLNTNLTSTTMIYADSNMIDLVIRNLLSNAIKFSRVDSTISIITDTSDMKNIIVCVKDSGVGIPDDLKDKIFSETEFYSSPGTANEQGTGLGLIISREFVKMHGGKIWFEKNVDQGVTFYFTLPQA